MFIPNHVVRVVGGQKGPARGVHPADLILTYDRQNHLPTSNFFAHLFGIFSVLLATSTFPRGGGDNHVWGVVGWVVISNSGRELVNLINTI